jgi:hypothetical protein
MPKRATGPARLRPVVGFDQELLEILNEIPDEQVVCRSGKHDFAMDTAEIGKPLPRSVSARPQHDGCYQIVDPCGRCGAVRITVTLPGGGLDGDLDYRLVYPKDWHRIPREYPHGRRVLRRENFRRSAPQIRALIRQSPAPDSGQAASPRPVAPVVFQGVS